MGRETFWDRVLPWRSVSDAKDAGGPPPDKVRNGLDLWAELYGSRRSKSGKAITALSALEFATVQACVRRLAEGVAQVPFKLYQEQGGRRTVQTTHPAHLRLAVKPNAQQTSYGLRETMMLHLALTGNFFAFCNRVGSRREVREITPIDPGRVEIRKDGVYRIRGEGSETRDFPAEAIWHVRGPSWDGVTGLQAVKLAREAIGLGIALEEDQAEFHASGARTSGLLSIDTVLNQQRYDQLAAWIDRYLPSGDRFQKPMLLDQGVKFTPLRQNASDAQTLEMRRLQVEEICRAFGVLPVMIGHADKTATYASAEQMFLAHVVHTLMPWYVRIEQAAALKFLSDDELANGFYFKFVAAGLMRGASRDRGEYFSRALGSGGAPGWMTPNEVRGLEELDRLDDGWADSLPRPPTGGAPGDGSAPPDE